MTPPDGLAVVADDRSGDQIDTATWTELAAMVLADEAVSGPAELSLLFVGAEEMAELNQAHRGHPGPTDVLAFPLDPDLDPDLDPETGDARLRLLGDVVVCPSVARAYAAQRERFDSDEMALLVVHGVLHVLGHDHHRWLDRRRMRSRERGHLRRWARSTGSRASA